MISIVSYGVGNTGSLLNMFEYLDIPAKLVTTAEELLVADKLLLPGVGNFGAAMQSLHKQNLNEAIIEKAKMGSPILGICLGMQLLTNGSEESNLSGLGLISGFAHKFVADNNLRVPNMGWRRVEIDAKKPLLASYQSQAKFYFVHSYYVRVSNPDHSLIRAKYGVAFDAAIYRDNIFGVQFHPEKSHKFGMMLLRNFAEL